MPYCARCGVEVDESVEACPLCSAAIPVFDIAERDHALASTRPSLYPAVHKRAEPLTGPQIRMSVWAALSAIFLISLLVVLAVNLVWTGGRITWSGYAMASIGLAWVSSTIILLLFRRLWLVVLCQYPAMTAFLAIVDVLDGSLDWFLLLGLPIASATALVAMASVIIWTFWKDRGANQLAILLGEIALLSLGIDLIASSFFAEASLSWSFIIVAVLVPLGGFFFIYHYVLRRFLKLKRIFHI